MYTLVFSINTVLIITFIIGLFNYKKYKHTPFKYFLFFLGYGLITEVLGYFFYDLFGFVNHVVYNIYGLVELLFYLWLFSKYFKSQKSINLINTFRVLAVIFFIVNTFYFQNIFKASQSYFLLFGGAILIVTIVLFFIEILNSDVILKLKHLPIFWIAVGLLLFQLGYIPVFIANKYINYSQGLTYGYILFLLNLISGICFSMGFIWSKKNVEGFNRGGGGIPPNKTY